MVQLYVRLSLMQAQRLFAIWHSLTYVHHSQVSYAMYQTALKGALYGQNRRSRDCKGQKRTKYFEGRARILLSKLKMLVMPHKVTARNSLLSNYPLTINCGLLTNTMQAIASPCSSHSCT